MLRRLINRTKILKTQLGPKLNRNTAKDILYIGTPLEKKFETVKF
jgi:hypothetical protein